MKIQANIWRGCTCLKQKRKPESKSKQVARDFDIPGGERETDFKDNLIWKLIKEPFP